MPLEGGRVTANKFLPILVKSWNIFATKIESSPSWEGLLMYLRIKVQGLLFI